jgi:hypothetical protein
MIWPMMRKHAIANLNYRIVEKLGDDRMGGL